MINIPYFKKLVKSNLPLLLMFTTVLCLFMGVMCYVFTPQTLDAIGNASPELMQNMVAQGTLIGFMGNSFYAMMAIIFPMVYSIVVGNSLVAKKIDDGSMAGFLSTPVSRGKIIRSTALYIILSLAIMWGIVSIFGIAVANRFQPDNLDIDKFLLLNLGAYLYHLSISSICFCSSCIFNTSKNSLTIGAGLPLIFFVISLLVKMSEDLSFMKYLTLNTLFDTLAILNEETFIPQFLAMGIIAVVLYFIGIKVFKKKDLPL